MKNSIRNWCYSNYKMLICLLAIFVICTTLFLYGIVVNDNKCDIEPFLTESTDPQISTLLTNNHTISQEFKLQDNEIRGLSLKFETYSTHVLDGEMNIKIFDDAENLLYSDNYSILEIFDDQNYNILFDDFVLVPNLFYKLEIEFNNIEEQKLSFYLSSTDQNNDFKTYINGIKQNADIVLNFIIENPYDYFFEAYVVIMIALLIIELLATILLLKSQLPLHKIYIFIAISIGLIYLLFIPLHVVPDEPVHNWSAYSVANTLLGRSNTPIQTIVMRYDDYHSSFQPTGLNRESFNQYFGRFFDLFVNDASLVETEHQALDAPSHLYLFSGLGIAFGQLLHLNTIPAYLLGRLFNLLIFVLAVQYSIRIIPFGKSLIFIWSILPMTLQQVASLSYDAPICTLCVLIISITINIMFEDNVDFSIKKMILLSFCILLLAPVKSFGLIPICFLPIIWLFDSKKRNSKLYLYLSGLFLSLVIVCIIFKFTLYNNSQIDEIFVNSTSLINRGYSIAYLLSNIKELFLILCNTLYRQSDFYLNSFLGYSLGWFELYIPSSVVLPYLFLMMLGSTTKNNENIYLSTSTKFIFLIISILTFSFAAGGMLTGFTPVGIDYIQGVQGRYFLPFAILSFLLLRTKKIRIYDSIDNQIVLTGVVLQYVVIFCLFLHFINL